MSSRVTYVSGVTQETAKGLVKIDAVTVGPINESFLPSTPSFICRTGHTVSRSSIECRGSVKLTEEEHGSLCALLDRIAYRVNAEIVEKSKEKT